MAPKQPANVSQSLTLVECNLLQILPAEIFFLSCSAHFVASTLTANLDTTPRTLVLWANLPQNPSQIQQFSRIVVCFLYKWSQIGDSIWVSCLRYEKHPSTATLTRRSGHEAGATAIESKWTSAQPTSLPLAKFRAQISAHKFSLEYDGAILSTTGTSRLGPGLVPAFGNVGKPVLCPSSNCNGRGRAIRSTFFQTNQQQTTPQTVPAGHDSAYDSRLIFSEVNTWKWKWWAHNLWAWCQLHRLYRIRLKMSWNHWNAMASCIPLDLGSNIWDAANTSFLLSQYATENVMYHYHILTYSLQAQNLFCGGCQKKNIFCKNNLSICSARLSVTRKCG